MPTTTVGIAGETGGRARILAAAVHLFAAKGYAATSVRDILRAATVTAPVLYYHFGSKEGLFLALARDGLQRLNDAVAAAMMLSGTVADQIRAYCRAHVTVRREYADMAWVVEEILSGPPEAAPRIDVNGVVANSIRQIEGLVRAGIESGELRPCNATYAALALLGAVEIAARPRFFGSVVPAGEDALDGTVEVILNGLAPR